jgi:ATP-binding protein involved in chromosome partitioning
VESDFLRGNDMIERIRQILREISHPTQAGDLISTSCVQNVEFDGGEVSLTLSFEDTVSRADRHETEDLIYDKLVHLEEIDDVEIEVEISETMNQDSTSPKKGESGLTLYGAQKENGAQKETKSKSASPSKQSADAADDAADDAASAQIGGVKRVKHLIAVGSGKGGVGKSTIAANLALSLRDKGAKVGVCDIDMYGPSVPILFGVQGAKVKADGEQKKFIPIDAYGLKVMSIGFLIDEETPVIWRGPIVGSIVKQFLDETSWGELDYLIIDLPPGTGDAQLTLTQSTKVTAALMVTTPSELSVADAIKGMQMFRKVDIPILGVVENMSYYVCQSCGHESAPFNQGGTERMCVNFGTEILSRIPLDDSTQRGGDEGKPIVATHPEGSQGQAFADLATQIIEKLPFQSPQDRPSFLSSLFKR